METALVFKMLRAIRQLIMAKLHLQLFDLELTLICQGSSHGKMRGHI